MRLPFTDEQFFDVFEAYNAFAWPAVVMLWLATLFFSVSLLRRRANPFAIATLAAIHWLWSGVVYHALFFTAINPAAWFFAVIFVLEGVAFIWYGLRRRLAFGFDRTAMSWAGAICLVYSLAYPFLALLTGHQIPRVPLFAVPCPTTIFTVGLLLNARGIPVIVGVIPIVWSVIGGTAALVFGVLPDFMLFAAAGILLVHAVTPEAQESRTAVHSR